MVFLNPGSLFHQKFQEILKIFLVLKDTQSFEAKYQKCSLFGFILE